MDNNGSSGSTDKAVELEPLRPPTRPPTVGSRSGTATGEFENAAAAVTAAVGLPPHHHHQQQPSGQDPFAGRSSQERARDEARKILQGHPIMTNLRNISKPTVGSAVTLADSEPGWAVIDGDIGGHGYNETKVDLIAVPCPGADPLHPWTCDPVTDMDSGFPEKPGTPKSSRPPYVWIQQGIRNKEPMIRVLAYKHRGLREGINIDMLAVDLLDQVLQIRQGVRPSRPLFFIAHSIGGLVVKRALLKAHEDSRYKDIRNNCHGVGFFATPHRGSSYMSMRNLRESVRELLQLQRPLPNSLINQIKVNTNNNPWLDKVHEQFVDIASELRIWSFYETIDSELSNTGADFASEVKFTAPLVSVKSALLELAREDVFAIDNSHANIASFGPNNISTMHDFLEDLHMAVLKAKSLSKHIHHPLRLKDHVKVEIVGFYEDSDPESDSSTRLYATKTQLGQYLQKGAEPFLQDRLSKVQHKRHLLTRAFTLKSSTVITETDDDDGTGPSSEVDSDASSLGSFSAPSLIVDHVSSTGPDLIHPELFGRYGAAHHAKKKITWIHVPFNNPIWAKEVIKRIEETRGQNLQKLLSREHWQSKQVQGLQAQSQPSFFKPCACLVPADAGLPTSPFTTPLVDRRVSLPASPRCVYLYLPYLHFDTYCNIIRRRKLIEKRLDHGRAKPVPEYVEHLESLELKVIWEYIGFDPPLNCRRTLDQFAYPSLKDTHARDDDQMLYKLTKHDQSSHNEKAHSKFAVDPPSRKSAVTSVCTAKGSDHDREEYDDSCSEDESESDFDFESDVKDGKLLMVDQLWLWAIDNDTLATFFPKRESSPKEGTLFQQADLRNIVYNELNGDLTGRTDNALDLAAFIVLHAVMAFVELSTHKDLDIFRIFEEAVSLLAERMTQNMRRFRTQNFISTSTDDLDDDDGGRTLSIKERHKRELEKAEKENRENTSALLELRDMEDELSTLLRLFETQEGVVNQLKEIYNNPSLKEITKNGQGYLDKAMEYLTEYKQLTSEMVKRVETTKKDYEKMLEMAQRQAQVDEVRWSRLQTELAASQNLSVMIFTTFTVIFLPLSFFTGIFGMNTREWHDAGADPNDPDGNSTIPTLGYIGAIALPVSFFLIFTSLIAAFSSRVQGICKKIFKATTGKIKGGYRAIKVEARKIEPERNKMRKQRKEAMRKRAREEEKARKQKELSYDFWADVMNARHERHQIPDVNKHDF
ncbi:hypothetical protein GE21DRAFT_8738 [Neurospora crassa]|uniref:DUF676 domain-containing protein n=1 Tax=Neurospora crassa (strain ATCC 24698 / 74-OR23-1A / CBS 708.71 / DSM 1257 / FGSC 987) TaxID=367110 RepID=Q7S641_NEUCR|nr:hypothetical protein NCU04767 [Neurospora crassa OR74A]EAA30980.3 hypothetical protein NCU04767 [Neurospora crassa OR74A]KHE88963.1 hypothetical protein GE21DRAFT_8738 [Neurospora crassa]|eukprot:XP_960216.3 hypothetical protein NCU04767 [Neurospora crassa OR74A]